MSMDADGLTVRLKSFKNGRLWNLVDLGGRLAGTPGRTRTCYLPLRRGTLYPDELRGHYREKGGMIAG
jgi:hypothetical protein